MRGVLFAAAFLKIEAKKIKVKQSVKRDAYPCIEIGIGAATEQCVFNCVIGLIP